MGTQLSMSTAFQPQIDGQLEQTIMILKDMLRAYVLDLKGSWEEHLCHAPDPGPTRLANPNRFRGAKPYTRTAYLFIYFFLSLTYIGGIQTIFVITNNHVHLKMNYHWNGIQ